MFSYGKAVLVFKYWGLGPEPATKSFPLHRMELPPLHVLKNFQLQCDCPWLRMLPSLELQSLSSFNGMPSCNCEVSADLYYWRYEGFRWYQVLKKRPSTSVAVVQARLWQSGAYQVPVLRGRIGTPLEISELKEHIPGFRWYEDDSDQALKLPVLENISSGARFAVSPAMSPEIRDVQCHDASNATYAWSRVTASPATSPAMGRRLSTWIPSRGLPLALLAWTSPLRGAGGFRSTVEWHWAASRMTRSYQWQSLRLTWWITRAGFPPQYLRMVRLEGPAFRERLPCPLPREGRLCSGPNWERQVPGCRQ